MSLERKIRVGARRRTLRIRARLDKTVPRVSVFRSLKHIYAQLIDDKTQRTLASSSSLELSNLPKARKEAAFAVGKELARRAQAQGISKVVFDRGSALYHGRVQKVAEGLRDGGLNV